ncbi:MAG: transcription termination factor NusA [Myxococcota bacterium]
MPSKRDDMQQGTLSLQLVIEQVSQEKGIDPKVLVEATEQAILTAAKRTFGPNRELEARFNVESGWVDLYQYMVVVGDVDNEEREISIEDAKRHGLDAETGEELGFQIFYRPEDADKARQQDREFGSLLRLKNHYRGFGRIAAQTAKQVIIQRVRDAERERIYNDYKDRRGELISGVVRRFERGSNLIVDIGRGIEACLPPREQTPRESYRPGDRIIAFLKEIDREARGPQLVLSRTDVGLLVKLFEQEVPEIYEGIVRIVAAAREPGARSKIAVSSRDSDVDPVGACVGMKGSRVQAVVQELRGEKIDIVPWDRDPARFVCNAIAPAEVMRVIVDETTAGMELVVPDTKLSLAIGRRGQNVRLASQLTGWKLDIISESRFKQIEEEAIQALASVPLVDETIAKQFYKIGFRTLDELLEVTERDLESIDGLSTKDLPQLLEQATGGAEQQRVERLRRASETGDFLNEREKLLLVASINERTVDLLEQVGYGSVASIDREQDLDRFAIRTGLDSHRAKEVKQSVETFLQEDWPSIHAAIRAKQSESRSSGAIGREERSRTQAESGLSESLPPGEVSTDQPPSDSKEDPKTTSDALAKEKSEASFDESSLSSHGPESEGRVAMHADDPAAEVEGRANTDREQG